MTRSELQDYGADEPVWRFIAQLARERFTGQADVGVETRVELYAADGRVYFAQKVDDPPLGARLVSTGVLTTEQFRNGSVKVGDSVSLARIFQRVPAIDRDAVELMTERLAHQLLESVSERPVGPIELHPLRHHPSGIHQWFPDDTPAPDCDESSPAMTALVNDVVAAVSVAVEPVAVEPVAVDVAPVDVAPGPVDTPAPALMTFEVLVTGPVDTALPTLSSLQGLTPLPTLGEVGTRMPSPATIDQPGPLDTPGLPILGIVGTSFQPLAAAPTPDPPTAAPPPPTTTLPPPPPTGGAAPLPPPTLSGPSPLDVTSADAMLTPALSAPPSGATPADTVPAGSREQSWNSVDELLGLPHDDATLVSAGGPSEDKKGRSWLRGRRG
jgi:hypothetical protein